LADIETEIAPAILTGPSFAADIAAGLPTALTLACADPVLGKALQAELSTPVLRLYRSADPIGNASPCFAVQRPKPWQASRVLAIWF
jgi:glycerol-3-phosphate dehydrogenase (NAD(P)+)